jgi:hypothetical protein
LDLLFDREPTDDRLEDRADCDPILADQATVIDIGENTHQKPGLLSANGSVECEVGSILAIHSISHSPMSRNAVAEIFDVESTLKSGGEEAAKWGDEGCKNSHDENM